MRAVAIPYQGDVDPMGTYKSDAGGYLQQKSKVLEYSPGISVVGNYRSGDAARSTKTANLPISMDGDMFALTGLTIYTPPGGVGCGSFLMQSFAASGKWVLEKWLGFGRSSKVPH